MPIVTASLRHELESRALVHALGTVALSLFASALALVPTCNL